MVRDVGFSRKAILALILHPKVQVNYYHLLGVMPRMGNQGSSVKHRPNLRVKVIQEFLAGLGRKTTQLNCNRSRVYCLNIVV